MITEYDLQEAIAECQGERHPNANTCIKLAAYYTIKEHLFPNSVSLAPFSARQSEPIPSYSYAPAPNTVGNTIEYMSDTDFGKLISGRDPEDLMPLVDELLTALAVVNPRLYDSFMRRLR